MTPHNEAKKEDIAKIVIMPGDPLRAKFIADHYLKDAVLVNQVRGMYAYTGSYKGKKITVMASGMGMPSMGIYSYELFTEYDVDTIIRIGSCGAYTKDLNLYDVIIVDHCYSESTYAKMQAGSMDKVLYGTPAVNEHLKEGCKLVGGLSIYDGWFCQALIKKYVCKERISNEKIK